MELLFFLLGSKSQGVGRWAPAATRLIAYAPNFLFPFALIWLEAVNCRTHFLRQAREKPLKIGGPQLWRAWMHRVGKKNWVSVREYEHANSDGKLSVWEIDWKMEGLFPPSIPQSCHLCVILETHSPWSIRPGGIFPAGNFIFFLKTTYFFP